MLFLPKNADVLQKNADISKIKRTLVGKSTFSETAYVCVLRYKIKFEFFSIILTSLRQGAILNPHT